MLGLPIVVALLEQPDRALALVDVAATIAAARPAGSFHQIIDAAFERRQPRARRLIALFNLHVRNANLVQNIGEKGFRFVPRFWWHGLSPIERAIEGRMRALVRSHKARRRLQKKDALKFPPNSWPVAAGRASAAISPQFVALSAKRCCESKRRERWSQACKITHRRHGGAQARGATAPPTRATPARAPRAATSLHRPREDRPDQARRKYRRENSAAATSCGRKIYHAHTPR